MTAGGMAPILTGRRGLVLGVSNPRSVGYRLAASFRTLGAELGVSYRPERRDVGARLAAELGATGLEIDARDEASVKQACEKLGEVFGRLDFLVHTLIRIPDGALGRPLLDATAGEFAEVMEIGVRSLIVACRYALPWLDRSPAPRVVALTSSGGELAIPNYHLAGIAKGALASTVRYLAQELGPRGILCNALCFSIVETDAAERVIGAERTRETRHHLAKRSMTRAPVSFDDVASSAAFLASTLCQNVTGESLNVDGGFSRSYF